jgi:hypothetical protein
MQSFCPVLYGENFLKTEGLIKNFFLFIVKINSMIFDKFQKLYYFMGIFM